MVPTFYHRFGCILLILLLGLNIKTQARTDTINSQGDKVIIRYSITHGGDDRVTITFKEANIVLGQNHKSFRDYQGQKNELKAIFVDGNNFEENEDVEPYYKDSNISCEGFTIPAGWQYDNDNDSHSQIFVINNEGDISIQFKSTGADKGTLKLPIYLAVYDRKHGRNYGVYKSKAKTTYRIFSECVPLEIGLKLKPTPNSNPKESSKLSIGVNIPQDEGDVVDEIVVSDDLPSDDQSETKALDLIYSIQQRLNQASSKIGQDASAIHEALEIYDSLESDMKTLEGYRSSGTPDLQDKIDNLKSQFDKDRKEAIKSAKEIGDYDHYAQWTLDSLGNRLDSCQWSWSYLFKPFDEIENIEESYNQLSQNVRDKVSSGTWIKIGDFLTRIVQKKSDLKPYLIIRKVVWALWAIIAAALTLLFHNRWKNILEQRKMKSFEEMQRKMVKRAEEQAMRRARSYTQNKARQVVGKAKNKGRQAVQSQARDVADRVRGKNPSSGAAPVIGDAAATGGSNRPAIGRFSGKRSQPNRRPKPGNNGEISI